MTIAHAGGFDRRATRQLRKAALAMSLLAAFPGTSFAVRINYDLGLSVLHSDNIGLAETDEASETVLSPQVNFQAEQTGSTVQMTLRGNLEYLHYLQNTFSDEARGELSGELNWSVLPERMDFVAKEYLTRQPINVLTGFNPSNQQQINVFITGPSFYARLGETTRGQFDLRYTNSYAEKTKAFNGDRYNAAARVLRDISTNTAISANMEATRVNFNVAAPATDYDRYDAYAGYARKLASIDFGIDAGYSWLDIGNDRVTTPMARANLTWQVSPRSEISGNLAYQFGDAAQDVVARAGEISGPLISDFTSADVLVGPAVFRQRRLEWGYRFSGERLTFQVRPYFQRIFYLDNLTPDQRNRGGVVQVDYLLRPRLTMTLLAAREDRDFDDLARKDQDSSLYLSLADQVTRHWSWRIDLQHRERNSSEAGQGYNENAAVFSVIYRR